MKIIFKLGVIFLVISTILLSFLLFFKTSTALDFILPSNVKITAKNTLITENKITLDAQVILEKSKTIRYLADTLKYAVYIDNNLLTKGFYNVDSGITNGNKDTLFIPVLINRKTIEQNAKKFKPGDSTFLKIVITNSVKLPIIGCKAFTYEKNIKIAAPIPPVIKVENVTKKKLSLKDAIYQLELDIYNPNYVEIELLSTDIFIDIKTLFKGNARSLRPIKIVSQGHSKVSIKIDIDDLQLIKDGFKILFKPNKEWNYLVVAKILVAQDESEPMELIIKTIGKTKLLGLK